MLAIRKLSLEVFHVFPAQCRDKFLNLSLDYRSWANTSERVASDIIMVCNGLILIGRNIHDTDPAVSALKVIMRCYDMAVRGG